jgi:exosortase
MHSTIEPNSIPVDAPLTKPGARLVTRRDLLLALVFTAASALIMHEAWRDIFRVGRADEECSYVLLAPFIIGWLAWVRKNELFRAKLRGGWAGLLILAMGWLVYWYGYIADPVIWRAGAVMTAVGAFVSVIGFEASFKLAPALIAAGFLVPVDPNGRYHVALPLQTITAQAAQQVCDVLGINVNRAGNLLSINGVDVTIAEACNGMRMLLTLFMVCYVVAFTLRLRAYVRIFLLAASPLVAIISNVARLVPTVWMFGHKSHEAAERFHDISGWVMTFLSFLLLMGFFRLLETQKDRNRRLGVEVES